MQTNIGFVIISGEFGGAETFLYKLLQKLDTSAFSPYLFVNERISDDFDDIPSVTVVSLDKLPYRSYASYVGLDRTYNRAERRLYDVCQTKDIELLVFNLPGALNLSRDNGITNIFVMHGEMAFEGTDPRLDIRYRDRPLPNRLGKRALRVVNRYNYKRKLSNIDHIACTCEYLCGLLAQQGIDIDCSIISNGVELGIRDERTNVLLEVEFPILYVGGARDVKGWDLLLDALLHWEIRNRAAKLYILRDVPDGHPIRTFLARHGLEDTVEFVGYCQRDRYLDFMYSCDLVCVPSYSESIPISVLEAMALGKPVVATDVGGTAEVLEHGTNGYLCETTPESIADGLQYFYEDRSKRTSVKQNNLETAEQYTWDNIIGDYEALFRHKLD